MKGMRITVVAVSLLVFDISVGAQTPPLDRFKDVAPVGGVVPVGGTRREKVCNVGIYRVPLLDAASSDVQSQLILDQHDLITNLQRIAASSGLCVFESLDEDGADVQILLTFSPKSGKGQGIWYREGDNAGDKHKLNAWYEKLKGTPEERSFMKSKGWDLQERPISTEDVLRATIHWRESGAHSFPSSSPQPESARRISPNPQPTPVLPTVPGWIGISTRRASAGGAIITKLTRHGPAEAAGLKVADRITELNGRSVNYAVEKADEKAEEKLPLEKRRLLAEMRRINEDLHALADRQDDDAIKKLSAEDQVTALQERQRTSAQQISDILEKIGNFAADLDFESQIAALKPGSKLAITYMRGRSQSVAIMIVGVKSGPVGQTPNLPQKRFESEGRSSARDKGW